MEFKEAKLAGDTLTFVEMFKLQDNEVQIGYTGKVSDDEINFTRKVGDFATQEFAAKRVDAARRRRPAPPMLRPPIDRGAAQADSAARLCWDRMTSRRFRTLPPVSM